MSKYLLVSHESSETGAPIFLYETISYCLRSNLIKVEDVDLITVKNGTHNKQFDKICNRHLKLFNYDTNSHMEIIKSFIHDSEYSTVYCNTLETSHIFEILMKLNIKTKKKIFHVHELEGTIQRYGGTNRIRVINENADTIIAVTNEIKENLVKNHHFSPEKFEIIPPFLRIMEKSSDQEVNQMIDNLELKNKKIVLGCGYVSPTKGTDFFISLVTHYCNKKRPKPDLHFIWVGSDHDNCMTLYKKELGISGAIKHFSYLGIQKKMSICFKMSDVFLLCSREDSFPLVCLEATSFNKPVVYFRETGGIKEFFENINPYVAKYYSHDDTLKQIFKAVENGIDKQDSRLGNKLASTYSAEHISHEIAKIVFPQ